MAHNSRGTQRSAITGRNNLQKLNHRNYFNFAGTDEPLSDITNAQSVSHRICGHIWVPRASHTYLHTPLIHSCAWSCMHIHMYSQIKRTHLACKPYSRGHSGGLPLPPGWVSGMDRGSTLYPRHFYTLYIYPVSFLTFTLRLKRYRPTVPARAADMCILGGIGANIHIYGRLAGMQNSVLTEY